MKASWFVVLCKRTALSISFTTVPHWNDCHQRDWFPGWRSEFTCMKVMVFVERNWPLSLWAPRKHRHPRLHIFQYKGYEAFLSTWLSEKHSFSAFFVLFSSYNVSGSSFPGCWHQRDSHKFLYVRCFVSAMKIPFWHTSRKVIHPALCQNGWLQQKPFWGLEKPVIQNSVI